jgi:hypothetical protein
MPGVQMVCLRLCLYALLLLSRLECLRVLATKINTKIGTIMHPLSTGWITEARTKIAVVAGRHLENLKREAPVGNEGALLVLMTVEVRNDADDDMPLRVYYLSQLQDLQHILTLIYLISFGEYTFHLGASDRLCCSIH